MAHNNVVNVLGNFEKITKDPVTFLCPQESTIKEVRNLLKDIYDYTKDEEKNCNIGSSSALPELIVDNFDVEQIWQQIELQNDLLTNTISSISKYVVSKKKLVFKDIESFNECEEDTETLIDSSVSNIIEENLSKEDEDTDQEDSDQSSDDESSLEDIIEDEEELALQDIQENDKETHAQFGKPKKKSIVDDDFFKLDEMEQFLLSEEKKINDKEPDSGNDSEHDDSEDEENDNDDIDYFKESDGDEEEEDLVEDDGEEEEDTKLKNPKYADFFGETKLDYKRPKRNAFLEELENELSDNDVQKSAFELREERLKKRIEKFEEKAVEDKPWQLKGEIKADSRPYNSLLEEVVEFDVGSRPAPVMTEETTLRLEDIIKQRIKDKAFDSVERKEKPVQDPLEYKKKLVLDQEKSKQSLAQIYEKEYLQQKAALESNGAEEKEEEPELHKEIKKMMHGLFIKLDALSNFHYTPKPTVPELKVVSNLPAVNMEEVAPVAASDAALLAPEEIKSKTKGEVMGKSERNVTDKKRERRKKKLKQREHANEKKRIEAKVEKMKPGFGNKYSKEKANKLLKEVTKHQNVEKMDETLGSKSLKSSTAFFTQLQDEVKSQIKTGTKRGNKGKVNKSSFDSKRIKL